MTFRRFPSLLIAGIVLAVFASLGWAWHTLSRGGFRSGASSTIATGAPKAAGKAAMALDQAERELLWQIEHHGLLLGKHGFQPLAQALRQQDTPTLTALCADDFTGRWPRDPREVRLTNDFAQVVRRRDAGNPPETLDRAGFIARLLEFRRLFTAKRPQIKLALMGLTPVNRKDLDGLWEGTCQLRMWGEKEPGKPAEVILYLKYRVLRPNEENLRKPGWLRSCTLTQSQSGHAIRPLLREVTAERGVNTSLFHDNWESTSKAVITGGVFLCDYDRNGILDMLVTDLGRVFFYVGQGDGKFREATTELGLPATIPFRVQSRGTPVGFADLDNDGWEDLLLGDSVFRNEEGKTFLDYSSQTNLLLQPNSNGFTLADYDRDGRIDLYISRGGKPKEDSWIEGKSGYATGNQLWRNLGNWQFENVTAASGTDGGMRSTFSAVWFDANNDRWPDLYVINEFGNGLLLANKKDGTFRPIDLVTGPGDFGSMGLTAGDIDNDGLIDLYIANMYSKAGNRVIGNLDPKAYPEGILARMRRFSTGSQLYHNKGGFRFDPVGEKMQVADVGWAYGPTLVDLDNDGWEDIFATCGFMSQSRDDPDG